MLNGFHGPASRPRPALLLAALILAALWLGRPAGAVTYTFRLIQPNGPVLEPLAINRSGVVVGKTLRDTAFIWTPTSFQEVAPPVGYSTISFISINSAGQIIAQVGEFGDSLSYTCPYVNGALGTRDPAGTSYLGLDDEGHKVGYKIDNGHAVALFDTTSVPVPNSAASYFTTVTNTYQGRILALGFYSNGGDSIPFLKDTSQADLLPVGGPPDAKSFTPSSVNDFGVIAGTYAPMTGVGLRGFVRAADGTYQSISYPGLQSVHIGAISNNGTIVGAAYNVGENFQQKAFIATPDNSYTIFDVISTLEFAGGLDNFQGVSDPAHQDLDSDGRITLHDAALMVRKLGGFSPNP